VSIKEVSWKTKPSDVVYKKFGLPKRTRGKGTCPYGVPPAKLAQVQDLQSFSNDLFKGLEWKVQHLEGDAKRLSKKLIGLKYIMEDHKAIVVEAYTRKNQPKCNHSIYNYI
jgi:hypothetical protein